MPKSQYAREILIALAALSIGWWAHSSRPVQAQAAGPAMLSYEFNSIGPGTSLSLYNPADNSIYIYPSVTSGNSRTHCSLRFRLGAPGGPIERETCPRGSLR
jgi:hypothetical protein